MNAVMASAMTPISGRAVTSLRSATASARSRVFISIVPSGCMRVLIGFIDARSTICSPLLMPPSLPPARLVLLRPRPASTLLSSGSISSWTSDPFLRAHSTPSPISTALTAGMDIRAAGGRPSTFLSHATSSPRAPRPPIAHVLDDAAQGVALCLRSVDPLDHFLLGVLIQRAQLRCVRGRIQIRGQPVRTPGIDPSQVHHMAPEGYVEFTQKPPANGPCGHAGSRFAGGGTLQHIPGISAVVLEHSGETDVPGPRARHCALALGIAFPGRGIHDLLPVLPVAILNQHRDRGAERLAGADA